MRLHRPISLTLLTVGLGVVGLAAWYWLSPESDLVPLPPGVGKVKYESLFEQQAGVFVAAEELVRLGSSEVERIESRMETLAGRIVAGAQWQQVFTQLRSQHPGGAAEAVAAYRRQVERAAAFVQERDLIRLPAGRLEVLETPEALPRENYPVAAYLGYKLAVTTSLSRWPWKRGEHLRNHCDVCIPPLVVHEAVPGHHVTFLHTRAAKEFPSDAIRALAQIHFKNKFYYEGWAQYGEVLMLEHGYYESPQEELGAWRMLLLRALRTWIDPQLHTGKMDPESAVALLESRLLLTRDAARAEVRRHMIEPATKTSYYVGMLQLLSLRKAVLAEHPNLSLREFHDRVLQWPLPIPLLAEIHFEVELDPPSAASTVLEVLPSSG